MATLISPYQYFADPAADRPISNGFIYIGRPGTDPTVEENQITVYLICECNGNRIEATQPIRTGSGGVPVVNGSPAQIDVSDEEFSITVQDRNGTQIFHSPAANGIGNDAETITYMIGPGERFTDWNQAFRFIGKLSLPRYDSSLPVSGTTVTFMLKSGYLIGKGLQFNGGDFSFVRITAEDSTVITANSFNGDMIAGYNTRMPRLAFLCDMSNRGQDGYSVNNGSSGYVEPSSGVINAGRNGLTVNSSLVYSVSSNFSLANARGLDITNSAIINAASINLNGCCKNNVTTSSFSAVSGCVANINNAMIMNSVRGSCIIERSCTVNMDASDLSGSLGGSGIVLTDGSTVNARNVTINNSSSFGANASNNCHLNMVSSTVSMSGNNNINVTNGSTFCARISNVSGSPTNIRISNSSIGSMISSTIGDSTGLNVWLSGNSDIDLSGTTSITGAGTGGILLTECSDVTISSSSSVTGNTTYGIRSERGSRANCSGATVSGNQAGNDLVTNRGGVIIATDCTTTNGSPDISDVNGATAFNTLTENGYIIS